MGLCSKGVARAKVRAANGKPSVLYNDLLKLVDSRDIALDYYAKANSATFAKLIEGVEHEKDVNGEAKAEFVKKTIDENKEIPLSKKNELISDNTERTPIEINFDEIMEDEEDVPVEMSEIANHSATSKTNNPRKKRKMNPKGESKIIDPEIEIINDDEVSANTDRNVRHKRMLIYQQAMNEIVKSISVKHSEIAARIANLRKSDNVADREDIVRLEKEITDLNVTLTFYDKKLSSLDDTIGSDELYNDISKQLDYISKELDKPGITHAMVNKFDKALKIWSNAGALFQIDGDSEAVQANIANIAAKAGIVNAKFIKMQDRLSSKQALAISTNPKLKTMSEDLNFKFSIIEDFQSHKDPNAFWAHIVAINRNPQTALQVLHKLVEQGHIRVAARSEEFNKVVDDMAKSIKDFEEFAETYKDGSHTGMMLHYISPEFREMEEKFNESLKRDGINAVERFKAKLDFNEKHKIFLDPRLLFADKVDGKGNKVFVEELPGGHNFENTYSDEARDKHIVEVIEALGGDDFAKEEFEVLKKRLEDKIDGYILNLDAFEEQRDEAKTDKEIAKFEKNRNKLILSQSPYIMAQGIKEGQLFKDENGKPIINHQIQHMPFVPRRFELNATRTANTTEPTGYYNDKFGKLISNATNRNFYRMYSSKMNELNSMLPAHIKIDGYSDNYVALIDKTFFQLVNTEGVGFSEAFNEEIFNTFSKQKKAVSIINKFTNEKEYRLDVAAISARESAIEDAMSLAVGQKVAELKRDITLDEEFELRRNVLHEINTRNRFNLADALKIFNYQVNNYMQRAADEDFLKSIKNILDNSLETQDGRSGSNQLNQAQSFRNLRKAVDYYVECYYGFSNPKTSKNKVHNKKDKIELEKIDAALNDLEVRQQDPSTRLKEEDYEEQRNKLMKAKDNLGAFISFDQIMHSALKYSQFKAMGFNYGAAVTNLIQGYVANTIESKDGRIFNSKQLFKAYALMGGSVLKFISGGNISTETADKVRNICLKYDLLGETSSEIEFDKFNKKNILNNIYVFQSSTEYMNQGPVVIATMLNTTIQYKNAAGDISTISLWDAMDKDGTLRTDIDIIDKDKWSLTERLNSGTEFLNTCTKITQAIRAIHGNYSKLSPTLMNSDEVLKSLKQFKTWMFESIAQRIEAEKYDESLGMDRKGRYRTGVGIFTWAKPKEYEEDVNAKLIINNTLFTAGQLMRRLVFLQGTADAKFSEVDAANIRKNISELVFTLRFVSLAMMAGMLLKGAGDDDDETGQNLIRYQINVANRLIDDLTAFYNPISFGNLTKNAVPLLSILTDVINLIKSMWYLANGTVTQTGVYAGEAQWIRYAGKSLPITSKVMSTRAMLLQQLNTVR